MKQFWSQFNKLNFNFLIARVASLVFIAFTPIDAMPHVQYMYPVPGSNFVSQQSNIIFRLGTKLNKSITADQSLFSVQGTKSGNINGKIVLSDDEKTLLFIPANKFLPGETISVSVNNNNNSLTNEKLDPVHFEFTVSPLSALEKEALNKKAAEVYFQRDTPSEVSQSTPHTSLLDKVGGSNFPPTVPVPTVKVNNQPAPGSIFVNPFKINIAIPKVIPSENQYILILDENNQPSFYNQTPGITYDLKVLSNGNLTYFNGPTACHYIMNNSYAIIDSFKCGDGYQTETDPHDIHLLANGHVLILGLDPRTVDMSTVVTGGKINATVIGIVVQELDLAKNVVFEWKTFDHFKVTDATHENLTASQIDYVHSNALAFDADSNILLSNRHMDEITKIDRSTGNIIWRWGGKNNQFTFINDTLGFSHQHSINVTDNGNFIMFDNGNFHPTQFSRALEYKLDQQAKTATLVWQFRHTPDTYTFAMGSVQRLPNGNTFIGWGGNTNVGVTEVRPDGSTAYEFQFPDSIISYRAYKFPWTSVASVQSKNEIPITYSLSQNYPNPFNPTTTINYQIPNDGQVSLKVYDVLGRGITTLVNEFKSSGNYSVIFDASNISSGMYFYTLKVDGYTSIKKMILTK